MLYLWRIIGGANYACETVCKQRKVDDGDEWLRWRRASSKTVDLDVSVCRVHGDVSVPP